MTLTIDIPDTLGERVCTAFAATQGYSEDSGQTKEQFVKNRVTMFLRDVTASYESGQAAQKAQQDVVKSVNDEFASL
jgi:hypothetical protein